MADATITMLGRPTPPSGPAAGKFKFYFNANTGEPEYVDDQGNAYPFGNPFGKNFNKLKRDDTLTTSDTAFSTYLNAQINNLDPAGTYRVAIHYIWGHASASNDFRARLLVNGVQKGQEMRVEPKDPGTDQRIHTSFIDYFDPNELQVNDTFEFQFASGTSGTQARMYSAILEFWRVA